MDLSKLKEPFPPDKISWRVGSTNGDKTKGMALAYIDARDVQDRLDQICGPENWQCRYPHANGKTVCEIGIRIGDEWIWKADGAGDTDVEAEKGALSDAFKRAAVRWGVGRYLYDMDSPWLAIEGAGKSYRFTQDSLAKLKGTKAPTQSAAPPPAADDKSAKAKAWGKDALAILDGFTDPAAFNKWYSTDMADRIERVKPYDANLHKQLKLAVERCLETFNPIGA